MKKLKVIQVGMRHEHANGIIYTIKRYLNNTFDLLGIVDDDFCTTPRFDHAFADFDGLKRFTMDEALNYPGLDAVFIETPNLDLVPTAMKFMERGIPIHMDKPAGETLEPYKKLLDGCQAKGVPLQMGYMYRGNEAFQFVQQLVRAGALGDLFEIELDMDHGYGGTAYQEYIGKFKGGIMFNLGCHLIDFIVSLMGAPEKVTPYLKSNADVDEHIFNNTLAVLEYPHCIACVRICSEKMGCVDERRMRISGTGGWVEMSPLEVFDGRPMVMRLALKQEAMGYPAGVHDITFPVQHDRYKSHLLEFAAMVRGQIKNPYTYEHDYLTHAVSLAASGYLDWVCKAHDYSAAPCCAQRHGMDRNEPK